MVTEKKELVNFSCRHGNLGRFLLEWFLMCLGIPGKVLAVKNKKAKIEQGDHCHWVGLSLIEEGVKVGDYLLSYQEAAINKISPKEAREILSLIEGA